MDRGRRDDVDRVADDDPAQAAEIRVPVRRQADITRLGEQRGSGDPGDATAQCFRRVSRHDHGTQSDALDLDARRFLGDRVLRGVDRAFRSTRRLNCHTRPRPCQALRDPSLVHPGVEHLHGDPAESEHAQSDRSGTDGSAHSIPSGA